MRLLSVVLLAALLAPAAPAQTPTPEAPLPPGFAPLPRELADRLVQLTRVAEQARGLAARRPVRAGLLDEAGLRRRMDEVLREELPPEKLARVEAALEAFGFVPEDLDLARYLPALLASQVAGFYDPEEKIFALVRRPGEMAGGLDSEEGDLAQRAEDAVVVHELVHALQDQHFDLDRFKGGEDPLADASSARDALVEGDATLAMFSFLLGSRLEDDPAAASGALQALRGAGDLGGPGALGGESLADAPPWLRESLLFSYVEGAAFCLEVLRAGGRALLDRAYQDPPVSTEQILHPEKWHARRDDPVRLAWPAGLERLLPGYRELVQGELGERDVALLLREALGDRRRAAAAAAGWGGDRFAVYGQGKRRLLVWLTVWDSAEDARELAAAAAGLGRDWRVERLGERRVALLRGDLPRRQRRALLDVLAGG
jgi:hypothetical protein